MFKSSLLLLTLALSFGCLVACHAQGPVTSPMQILPIADGAEKRLTPSSDQVTIARVPDAAAPGIGVTIQPGKEDYPGVSLKPTGASWDLSAFG
ncbi:MAG: hypothetical protein M3Y56_17055, partial [Armatimonadota bacterium]|nr:hypothetical protein [Armatimonadota bacterium]